MTGQSGACRDKARDCVKVAGDDFQFAYTMFRLVRIFWVIIAHMLLPSRSASRFVFLRRKDGIDIH
jgi:hypothetical protein